VTVAGRPTVVYDLAKQWQTLSGRTADSLRYLAKLRALLFDGPDGWRGTAATEYQRVLDEIAHRIEQVEHDCQKLARNLDRTGQSLSTAVADIPVPVDVGHDVLVFGRTHELPGGTDLDDGDAMRDPNAFVRSLVADYRADPGRYRDFRATLRQSEAYGTATDGRYARGPADTGGPGGADERRRRLIDAWYEQNAAVAGHAFDALRAAYNEQAPGLDLDRGALDVPAAGGAGGGTGTPVAAGAPMVGGGAGTAVAGGPSEAGGTRLAGSAAPRAATPPPAAGLVRPGLADAGPGLSPTVPLTSPREAVLAGGAGVPDGGAGGAMPVGYGEGGTGRAADVAYRSWLGEEDDAWRVELGPPGVIE
jgi:hypothetical protein